MSDTKTSDNQGGGGDDTLEKSFSFLHPNFLKWFTRNKKLSLEADIGLFIAYWVGFFYLLFLSYSIYQYSFKRDPGKTGILATIGFIWMILSIIIEITQLIFKGNTYVPIFINVLLTFLLIIS